MYVYAARPQYTKIIYTKIMSNGRVKQSLQGSHSCTVVIVAVNCPSMPSSLILPYCDAQDICPPFASRPSQTRGPYQASPERSGVVRDNGCSVVNQGEQDRKVHTKQISLASCIMPQSQLRLRLSYAELAVQCLLKRLRQFEALLVGRRHQLCRVEPAQPGFAVDRPVIVSTFSPSRQLVPHHSRHGNPPQLSVPARLAPFMGVSEIIPPGDMPRFVP